MHVSESLVTERLKLRRPVPGDEKLIFSRYAGDPLVTRYLCWPTHRTFDDTREFLVNSERAWHRWPVGPYLIESRDQGVLLGSVGITWENAYRAALGYALARDAWGQGYATEAIRGLMQAIQGTGLRRLYALCHHRHQLSSRVLEKCDFSFEGTLRRHTAFPNLGSAEPCDVLCYARIMNEPEL